VVLGFALLEGVRPTLSWLELPLIIAMLAVFATGVAMLLSALFVTFRDVQPIWDVISQVLFYASPVIISVETVRERVSEAVLHLYMLNPLAVVFQQFRHAVINHSTLSAGQALGGWGQLAEPLAIVVAVFALGFLVFNRSAPLVAENL
jgi:ABC-2 type transport system permease protein